MFNLRKIPPFLGLGLVIYLGPNLGFPDPHMPEGTGYFSYDISQNQTTKSIGVWYHRPLRFSDHSAIIFLFHGSSRNGKSYRDAWIPFSNKKNVLIVAPEFSKASFPGSLMYHRANLTRKGYKWNDRENWLFPVIDELFSYVQEKTGNQAEGFHMFGLGAGGHFVHRMVIFSPESKIIRAIASNTGSYTFPDFDIQYPYGLKGSPLTEEELIKALEIKLILMPGGWAKDDKTDDISRTDQAQKQGPHILERAENFYDNAYENALKVNADFNWELRVVPGVVSGVRKLSSAAWKEILD